MSKGATSNIFGVIVNSLAKWQEHIERTQKKQASFKMFCVDDAKYSSSRKLVLVEWSCEIFLEEGGK